MPIPAFTIDGILPPFVGADPGGAQQAMTPYEATSIEVVQRFSTTPRRRRILRGWLEHRAGLQRLGFRSGMQWLDGSFMEEKEPNDLDVVSFIKSTELVGDVSQTVHDNPDIFNRPAAKAAFLLDAIFLDFDGTPDVLVNSSAYFLGLFSHQRVTFMWKGMLRVAIGDAVQDDAARAVLADLSAEDGA